MRKCIVPRPKEAIILTLTSILLLVDDGVIAAERPDATYVFVSFDEIATADFKVELTICKTEPAGTLALVIPLNWLDKAIVPDPFAVSSVSTFILEAIIYSPVLQYEQ